MRLVFRGNRAAIGPVIYASDVDVCEWYDARSPFFEDIQESWTFMEMSNNYLLRGTSELDLPDYYIQTVAHSIWLPEDKGIVGVNASMFVSELNYCFSFIVVCSSG